LGKADTGVVFDNAKRFVHAACEIERVPREEIGAECVEGCYAVLDDLSARLDDVEERAQGTYDTVDCNVGIEPYARPETLHVGDKVTAEEAGVEGVMRWVLGKVYRMPMPWVADREHEVEHRAIGGV